VYGKEELTYFLLVLSENVFSLGSSLHWSSINASSTGVCIIVVHSARKSATKTFDQQLAVWKWNEQDIVYSEVQCFGSRGIK